MSNTFKRAVIETIPVLLGYLFIGLAFGLLFYNSGYGVMWSVGMAVMVYGGSLQFALIPLITSHAGLITVAALSLSISSRQMFYGLSFIEKFKKMGKKGLFMVYALTDETYSVLTKDIDDVDKGKFDFYVALLDAIYWVVGCALGSLFGSLLAFDTTGIDFAMTGLFVVICTEQWIGAKNHIPAVTGAVCAVISLLIFGADSFIFPALISRAAVLMLMKKKVEAKNNDE